ncbi:Fic family protein [Mycobacterium lepraemurium]|nr:Fic family protein [Mycobacterium lepraemurium]ATA29323.1 Fic family protein [Mycobacterium lepraemurium]
MSSAGSGTAIECETLNWAAPTAAGYQRSDLRAARRQSGEYQAAIPAAIADLAVSLPSRVQADAGEASQEIARFDTQLGDEIAPFASVLLRTESAASSKIDNLTASARAIVEAETLGTSTRRNASMIVANTRAMQAAIDLADQISDEAILAMHRALMHASEPSMAGKWRTEQVWIGGGNFGRRGAEFIAPHHGRVPGAIDDLARFAKRTNIAALPQIAIAHAQFETIHPLPDGNGRTGRALVQSMLRNKRLTRQVTVPVSAGLLTDTGSYFDALTAYRQGDPAPIVERLSEASMLAVANGRRLVTDLKTIRLQWKSKITARHNSAVHRLADLLIRRPVINAQLASEELHVAINNVYRYLDPLVESGIIVEFTNRTRNRAWRAPDVLSALDAFAERAGRRSLLG